MGFRLSDLPTGIREQATEQYARELAVLPRPEPVDRMVPAPDPQNVEHGRKAREKGAKFESDVDKAVKAMRSLGIADLAWDRPAVCIVRGDRNPTTGKRPVKDAYHTAKGAVDLSGTLAGGRAVRVELKACREQRMSLARYMTPGEREALDRYVALGALAFLLVRFDVDPAHWYLVPWAETRGRASVGPEERWRCRTTLFLEGV